jgi:hypothetical protein
VTPILEFALFLC